MLLVLLIPTVPALAGDRFYTTDEVATVAYQDKPVVDHLFAMEEVTCQSLRLIRNAIFARHNYRFKDRQLVAYYAELFPEYRPQQKKMDLVGLSANDRKNLDILKSFEARHQCTTGR